MTYDDWPRVRTDVDDDRPAIDDEVEYCQYCERPVLDGELRWHMGSRRCEECLFICAGWCGEPVHSAGEFCEYCAMAALGAQ